MNTPTPKQKPTPKVKDQFWFDMSAKIINESISTLDKGLAKLDAYITALWVIYTTASIFSIKYLKLLENDFYWFILIPHLLLLLGRCFVVLSQMPIRMDLVVNAPVLIKKSYVRVFERKRISLLIGSIFALLGTIAVIITLTYSFQKNNQLKNLEYGKANRVSPDLIVNHLKSSDNLIFTAEITPKTKSEITISAVNKNNDTTHKDTLNRISTQNGTIHGEFKLPEKDYQQIKINIKWIDINQNNIEKSLSRLIENKEHKLP
ncbi:MAG: hypothetical protein AAFZ89_01850 [Bacteroidota bacterium]